MSTTMMERKTEESLSLAFCKSLKSVVLCNRKEAASVLTKSNTKPLPHLFCSKVVSKLPQRKHYHLISWSRYFLFQDYDDTHV